MHSSPTTHGRSTSESEPANRRPSGALTNLPIVRFALLIAALIATVVVAPPGTAASADRVPPIAHVVVIVFENHERRDVLGSGTAPTFEHLASTYAQATSYYAVAHPSLPNYLALVSGSTHGVTSDCTDCIQTGPTIGTQLSDKHLNWAAYAEDYPRSSGFAKKHVPFLYFHQDASHVLPLQRFNPRKLPSYSLIIPNLCHDMHDCSVATGDHWLHNFIPPLLNVKDTATFIVFDEGTSNLGGGGNVPLIVAGTAVRRHAVVKATTSHYGLLRTIEAAFGLRYLGNARSATPLTGIFK
jgi:phosphatidylinositol-3-phosphatase